MALFECPFCERWGRWVARSGNALMLSKLRVQARVRFGYVQRQVAFKAFNTRSVKNAFELFSGKAVWVAFKAIVDLEWTLSHENQASKNVLGTYA